MYVTYNYCGQAASSTVEPTRAESLNRSEDTTTSRRGVSAHSSLPPRDAERAVPHDADDLVAGTCRWCGGSQDRNPNGLHRQHGELASTCSDVEVDEATRVQTAALVSETTPQAPSDRCREIRLPRERAPNNVQSENNLSTTVETYWRRRLNGERGGQIRASGAHHIYPRRRSW